jgi:hypothetical protein
MLGHAFVEIEDRGLIRDVAGLAVPVMKSRMRSRFAFADQIKGIVAASTVSLASRRPKEGRPLAFPKAAVFSRQLTDPAMSHGVDRNGAHGRCPHRPRDTGRSQKSCLIEALVNTKNCYISGAQNLRPRPIFDAQETTSPLRRLPSPGAVRPLPALPRLPSSALLEGLA